VFLDKAWLYKKYVAEGKSFNEIGKEIGRNGRTIRNWLEKYDIPRRGCAEHFLGKERSEEIKRKISASHIGKRFSDEHRESLRISHLGYEMPAEQRKKISNSLKGRKLSKENRDGISKANKNKVRSLETKMKLSELNSGERNPHWKGGKSFEPYCFKFNEKKKEEIRNRDSRVCQLCGKSEIQNGEKMSVHHIDGDKA
jgi:hypothetical protein